LQRREAIIFYYYNFLLKKKIRPYALKVCLALLQTVSRCGDRKGTKGWFSRPGETFNRKLIQILNIFGRGLLLSNTLLYPYWTFNKV
jgi:hypothetical protein